MLTTRALADTADSLARAAPDTAHAVHFLGVPLIGLSSATGKKVLLTLALLAVVVLLRMGLKALASGVLPERNEQRARFWTHQAIQLATFALLIVGIVSLWFGTSGRLGGAAGLVTAGVAVALQRVITSFAAYLILLRGKTFTVGDRITMGGVRGDVVALGFMQTTVMEMGQPPGEQADPPSMWVHARQYSGRVVRITNDKIFDSPVYNYTREFPYLWEEMRIPIAYKDDRARAEQILLDAARRHTAPLVERSKPALEELRRVYRLKDPVDVEPRVYWRLTDNWVELTVRFIAEPYGVRGLKDAMSRDIIAGLDAARIGIASGTYEIVGFPTVRVRLEQ